MTNINKLLSGVTMAVTRVIDAAAAVAGVALVTAVFLIAADVTGRNVFSYPLAMADEFSAYLHGTVIFLGLAVTLRERRHIRIDIVVRRLPQNVQNWLEVSCYFIGLAFVVVFFKEAVLLTAINYQFSSRALTGLHIRLFIPISVMVVGTLLLGLQFMVELPKKISSALKQE